MDSGRWPRSHIQCGASGGCCHAGRIRTDWQLQRQHASGAGNRLANVFSDERMASLVRSAIGHVGCRICFYQGRAPTAERSEMFAANFATG